MSRILSTTLALLVAALPAAASGEDDAEITFDMRDPGDDAVRLHIRRDEDWSGRRDGKFGGNWSQSLAFADLGLSAGAIARGGPISFAWVRPAGRFDCKGTARNGRAEGDCSFTLNAAFSSYLAGRGIERPTRNENFGLAISGVDSDVVDALIAEGMGTPTPEQLIALGIFRVTPDYIRAMAHLDGVKVETGDLVQFRIFRITPESAKAYGALGYRNLPGARPRHLQHPPDHAGLYPRAGGCGLQGSLARHAGADADFRHHPRNISTPCKRAASRSRAQRLSSNGVLLV